jgi:glycine dehydrogenase
MPPVSPTLTELEHNSSFIYRHIGPSEADIIAMLETLNLDSLDALINATVPEAIRSETPGMAGPRREEDVLAEAQKMAARNHVLRSMIGMGYHDCFTPTVILRNVLENPAWYTAYTPYQAEISQGRLEALLTFQQMTIDLTGLDIANASLLDEGTAAAEAMTLMKRVGEHPGNTLFVAADCHPQTIAVIRTRAQPLGIEILVGDPFADMDGPDVFGAIVQYPSTNGDITDYSILAARLHDAGALLAVATDPLALVLLTPPGDWGADMVVGSAQRFGVPMGYGGPHAAFFATREKFKRSIPGRLIGVSIDSHGRPALRMALQTREQHIRREKATSNICTAQVLLANIAAFYAVYHGPDGLKRIAERVQKLTAILAEGLQRLGLAPDNETFFDTLTVAVQDAEAVHTRAIAAGINLRRRDDGRVGISLDETTTREDVAALWHILSSREDMDFDPETLDAAPSGIPKKLIRTEPILEHEVFHAHRSETAMLRHLTQLAQKDLALDRAMIPLGSCTMKLNATAEMIPVTWPGFSRMHPFVPGNQAEGYRALFVDLSDKLARLTGFAAMSLQPNAGSQGEYAGLLAIRAYHASRGEANRNICLIPASAHGTNPASAVMANFLVVVVACDDNGNIDLIDLEAKANDHASNLGALMVTYPSTHGVFEAGIHDMCRIIHEHGGQVYLDGANFNAMVGISRPGEFGADVAHLNLHKTFCIPHGGGGPGIGPIGVAAHLAPFLPNHPLAPGAGPASGVGPVAAAPWGSASILPISWAYITLMGGVGLKRATQVAILNANYVARRLSGHFKVLFTGRNDLVAHECIIDTRSLKDEAGISVDDIAKRLIDYGFHAPTMSWPVAGTLMIEPTESENKLELDRFCDALIAIHGEAQKIAQGDWPADDNPLVNAPHTISSVTDDDWSHPYPRSLAAFPVPSLRNGKYWPPVGRVDGVYGDRHLVCSCPPLEAYQDAAE